MTTPTSRPVSMISRVGPVIIVALAVLAASPLAVAEFAAFSGEAYKHGPELKVLRESRLGKIEFSKDSLQDAVTELNATLAERGQPRVNFAIRGGKATDRKIVIRSKDTNFAEAFDSACAQAGYTWSVVLNRKIGSISVVATPNEEKEG